MRDVLDVAAAQVGPVPFDPQATIDKFEDEVGSLVRTYPSADLLLFPELYLTGEDPFSAGEPEGYVQAVAEPVPGPLTERVSKVAASAKRWVLPGSILERSGDEIYNTALLFSPEGDLVARHRKTLPWRPFETTTAGDKLETFELGDFGRAGIMICYEGWFPEVARALALGGARVILQPALTPTPDRSQELLLARANAIVNQLFVLNVNSVGSIGGGWSIGVDPEGRVLFEGGETEQFLFASLRLDDVARVRSRGTLGLNRLWTHFQDAPDALFEPYATLLNARSKTRSADGRAT